MSKLKAGIIGSGKIAQVRHIPEYLQRNDVELVAICDVNLQRVKKIAQTHNISFATNKQSEILQSSDIELISICTPNALHSKYALEALNHNKHVLVEKPMATNLKDLKKLYKTVRKHNLVLMPGHNQRFDPVHRQVKELIDNKAIGNIIQFTSNYQHPGPQFWSVDKENSWFFNKKLSSFGALGDLAIHKLDLIQWLINQTFSEWFVAKNKAHDSRASISLRTRSGIVGSINVSWNNPLQDHRTVLYGTKGTIVFGEELHEVSIHRFNGETKIERIQPILRKDGKLNSGIIDHFVECVKGTESLSIDSKHVKNSLKVILS